MVRASMGKTTAGGAWLVALGVSLTAAAQPAARASAPSAPNAPGASDGTGRAAVATADRAPWVLLLGGASTDSLVAVAEAARRGYFVAGSTISHGVGNNDVRVALVRPDGKVTWELAIGGPGLEDATSIVGAPDGGCLVAGMTTSFGAGGLDAWLVRLGPDGEVIWQRTFGGAEDEIFASVARSPSGFYVGGTQRFGAVNADAWLLELDANGDVVWQETLAGESDDYVTSVAATPDGLVIVASSNSLLGGAGGGVPFFRPWLVKLDAGGNVLWQRTYNVSGGDYWIDVEPLPDGGFAVTGEVLAAAFFRGDVWLVRLDKDGNVVWDRRFGDHLGNLGFDGGRQVAATRDGGFTLVGSTETGGSGGQDMWLIHVTAGGELAWQRTYGASGYDDGYGVIAPREGGLVVAGNHESAQFGSIEGVVLRLDRNGGSGAACDLSGPSGPNLWTSPIELGTSTIAPTRADFVPAASDARVTPLSTGALICPGR